MEGGGGEFYYWPQIPGFPYTEGAFLPFPCLEMMPPPPLVRLPRVMRKFMKGPPLPKVYKPRIPKRHFEPVVLPEEVCWGEEQFEPDRDMLGPLPKSDEVSPVGKSVPPKLPVVNKLRVGKSFQCPIPVCTKGPISEKIVLVFPRGQKVKQRRELGMLEEHLQNGSEIEASPLVVSLIEPEEVDIEIEEGEQSVMEHTPTQDTDDDVLEIKCFGRKRKYDKRGKARKSKKDIGARGNGDMRFFHRYEEIMSHSTSTFSVN